MFLHFREVELCGSNVKKFLIFQETELFYISGNRNPKKLLIFEELTFQAQEIKKIHPKKILIFQEMETKKKCIMFSQYFLIFSFISKNGNKEKKPSYFGKRYFFIFRKKYIQNPGIFRNLTYLELEVYSESWYIAYPKHI